MQIRSDEDKVKKLGGKTLTSKGMGSDPTIERDPDFSYPTIKEPIEGFVPFPLVKKILLKRNISLAGLLGRVVNKRNGDKAVLREQHKR